MPSTPGKKPGALFAGEGGLAALRALASSAGALLAPGGELWCEIGCSQGEAVAALPCGASHREEGPVPKPERQVLVCVNSRPPGNPKGSCSEKGGQDLFERLKALLRERGLDGRVMASRTYCLKHCSRGPVLAVQPDNVWYAGVTATDLSEICASHLEGGTPVERLLMPDVPWELGPKGLPPAPRSAALPPPVHQVQLPDEAPTNGSRLCFFRVQWR